MLKIMFKSEFLFMEDLQPSNECSLEWVGAEG